MTRVSQLEFFSWKDIENLGDLERLQLVIETMPDESLMQVLEKERSHGRNDNPIRPMWNTILAGIIYDHPSIESLIRELKRNAQLRQVCDFSVFAKVPSKSAYSRFLISLLKHKDLIDEIQHSLLKELREKLPDFGKYLAIDGKAVKSLANAKKKTSSQDYRAEHDADWGVKTYQGIDETGKAWKKVKSWFGFRIHLISDALYELPIAYEVTKASVSEKKVMKSLVKDLSEKEPEIMERAGYFMGDKGFDSEELVSMLWDRYSIKPIIDIRNMWKDKDPTRVLNYVKYPNVCHDYKGTIYCHCPITSEVREMAYKGFEKKRNTLKYQCPKRAYGIACRGAKYCSVKGSLRIPLNTNRRIFTPVARSSYQWQRLYNMRTSIERINSRLDLSFGFEKHFVRGLKKMNLKTGITFCVMLTIAVGRLRQNKEHLMRSLVRAA
jgi:transposase